jgi:hypothetical protein
LALFFRNPDGNIRYKGPDSKNVFALFPGNDLILSPKQTMMPWRRAAARFRSGRCRQKGAMKEK